jgi:hypothetical protein
VRLGDKVKLKINGVKRTGIVIRYAKDYADVPGRGDGPFMDSIPARYTETVTIDLQPAKVKP